MSQVGGGTDLAALVALLRTRPDRMSWPDIAEAVAESGSAAAVWDRHAPPPTLDVVVGPDPLEQAQADLDLWAEQGLHVLSIADDSYPLHLKGVHEAPPVLFARGHLRAPDVAVSVVGSRAASPRGKMIAAEVSRALVAAGITVASGLARGIDGAAHTAALDAGGRTVAFIATGVNGVYPAEHRRLQERIAEAGAVFSQFWPDAPPQKHNFLLRNATMSGYGIATVVVEAGENSGARAQARMAVRHGRPVILTDLVVSANDWAKVLVGQPRVYVAKGVAEVVEIVDRVRDDARAVDTALASILSLADAG